MQNFKNLKGQYVIEPGNFLGFLSSVIILFYTSISFSQPLTNILPKNQDYIWIQPLNLSWNKLNGSLDYKVYLSQDPSFLSGVIISSNLSTTNWNSPFLSNGLWYWKIEANMGSISQFSGVFSFKVFTPDDDPNLSLWLNCDSGIVLDVNNFVQEWQDHSSNGYIISQSNSPNRPFVESGSINGMPSVRFSGNQFLSGGDILDLGLSSRSMFVVGQVGSNDQTLFAKSVAAGQPSRFALIKDGLQTALIMQEIAPSSIYSSTNNTQYAFYQAVSNRVTGKNYLYINNLILGNSNLSPSYNFNSTYRFLLGAYSNASDNGEILHLQGNIAEIIFTDTSDSLSMLDIKNYLRFKYCPPVNLGADSSYNQFCQQTIQPTHQYENYLWNTGETTSSINISNSGTYWVQVTDRFGYISIDSIEIKFPEILTSDTIFCLGNTITWDTGLSGGYNFLWSTGETSSAIVISTPGPYSVTVSDSYGCSAVKGAFEFSMDSYENIAFLGNDTTLCAGNLLDLQVGAGETEEYYWNGISTGAQPSFWAVDTTGNYFLESVNVNGCVARDTIFVDIIGEAPVAGFSVSNVCDQSAAVFTDTSSTPDLSPVDEWLWTFGDGQQSTEQNPQHIFSSGPGTYNVQLYVAQGGCGAFFNAPIEVFQLPQADFTMSGFCDGEASAFVDQSIEGSGGITGWLWNFGQPSSGLGNVSVQQNPSKSYGETGSFTVTLEVTDANNCTDQAVQTITINKSPLSAFTASDICAGDNITFSNTSSIPSPDFIQSYLWDFGDNTYSILPVPGKTYTSPGYRTISLNVTAGNGCSTTSQQQILVHAIPVPGILVGPSCVGTYTSLTDVSQVLTGVVASSSWEIDLNTTLTGSPAAYVFTTAGSHNIELTTTSDFGCTNDTMIVINVNPELDADFEVFPSVVIVGEPVEFQNNSVGAINYSWELGDGTLSSNFEPINTYGPQWIDSTLTAILYVTNSYGCEDTTSVDFSVNKARFDLEVRKLFVSEQNGFYNVGVELKNVGTALIEYTDVELRLSNGTFILERFEDTLLSGQSTIKVFTSKPASYVSTQDEVNAWICAEGTPYSALNLSDEDLSNNRYCRNAEGEEPVLIGPNPNPASTEFEFSVLVSKESVLTVDLIDARGRIVKSYFDATTVTPGLYTYTVSLLGVNSGVYLLRMNGEVKRMVVE